MPQSSQNSNSNRPTQTSSRTTRSSTRATRSSAMAAPTSSRISRLGSSSARAQLNSIPAPDVDISVLPPDTLDIDSLTEAQSEALIASLGKTELPYATVCGVKVTWFEKVPVPRYYCDSMSCKKYHEFKAGKATTHDLHGYSCELCCWSICYKARQEGRGDLHMPLAEVESERRREFFKKTPYKQKEY